MNEDMFVKRPAVARTGSRLPALLGGAAALALGLGVFLGLDARRAAHAEGVTPPPVQPIALPAPQPLPSPPPTPVVPAPQFTVNNSVPTPAPPPPPAPMISANATAEAAALKQRLSAPTLIVDFGSPEDRTVLAMQAATVPGAVAAATGMQVAPTARGSAEEAALNSRVGNDGPERVRAGRIGALDTTIPQGAMIEAVLETALDSDLPGYARALVARDVLSFDGTNVLIPRGSRVIGQYKAATALGQSRVFVIWSRIIRPDGVSIQLASPGTDELGRAGAGGKVDRHFLQRFGGSILLSVLNGGMAAASAAITNGNGVYIGSLSDATGAATSALRGTDIPPTIRTPQGAAVRIFVARDLDFSRVGAMP